jgi:hypothetical protein
MRRDFAAFRVSQGCSRNWRLAKSLARSRFSRAKTCADPRPNRCNVSCSGCMFHGKMRHKRSTLANLLS